MLIDSIAERYGLLPSEVLARANTFDMFILDTAIGYRNFLQDKQNNGGKTPFDPGQYSQQELLEIHKSGKSKSTSV